MELSTQVWPNEVSYIRQPRTVGPVLFFCPDILRQMVRRFQSGFPGAVTYAVKANPTEQVLNNLLAAGIDGFDVASVPEIELASRLAPARLLNYNNPVRSRDEITAALEMGVRSFSLDSASEFDKLSALAPGETELSVRFRLPVEGAAYDFGSKFGASPEEAADLLARVAAQGFRPSLTFHPGTQCEAPDAWDIYIRHAARIAARAGAELYRLNVGGGFPARRQQADRPPLEAIFERIRSVSTDAFGSSPPLLLCEPGRGMVAESMALGTRVRAVRDGDVFLDDGIYGGLMELAQIGVTDRISVFDRDGQRRAGPARARTVFGPTCDSLDRLPEPLELPDSLAEGDWLIFSGLGAYSSAMATRFNGFGGPAVVTVQSHI